MLVGSWFQKALYVGIAIGVLAACGDDETTKNPTTTSGTGNTGNTGGMGGDTGGGGTGGSAPACSSATAEDLTGMATVTLTWANPFTECARIAVGTDVTWNGTFATHPLAGGTSPTVDPTSPITEAMATGTTVTVTFDTMGEFPFFCQVHTATMKGTFFVE
jgi:plastocyanin